MKFCVGFFQVGNPHVSITSRVWTNAWWKIFIHSHFHPFSTVKEMKWNTILKLQLVVLETIEPQMIRNIHDLDNLKLFSMKTTSRPFDQWLWELLGWHHEWIFNVMHSNGILDTWMCGIYRIHLLFYALNGFGSCPSSWVRTRQPWTRQPRIGEKTYIGFINHQLGFILGCSYDPFAQMFFLS